MITTVCSQVPGPAQSKSAERLTGPLGCDGLVSYSLQRPPLYTAFGGTGLQRQLQLRQARPDRFQDRERSRDRRYFHLRIRSCRAAGDGFP
jgi:hypothetical protein